MAINAQGTSILIEGPGSPATYAAIEEVTNIAGPDGNANLIDVSHLGSTGKEYLPGLADAGSITLTANFTGGTVQMQMLTAFQTNADAFNFRIKIPKTSARATFHQFDFKGIVTKWSLNEAVDAKVGLSMTVQTSGGVTYSST